MRSRMGHGMSPILAASSRVRSETTRRDEAEAGIGPELLRVAGDKRVAIWGVPYYSFTAEHHLHAQCTPHGKDSYMRIHNRGFLVALFTLLTMFVSVSAVDAQLGGLAKRAAGALGTGAVENLY